MILGTVTEISLAEARVLIDGESTPTTKYYKCSCKMPSVGDRVTIEEKNGSYVVTGILDNSLRWSIPSGTSTLTVTLKPETVYFAIYSEFANDNNVTASRMAMVTTAPSTYPSNTTMVTEFATTGTSKPITGLTNFQIRINKITVARNGYLTLIKM
jgi:hypothetical protein